MRFPNDLPRLIQRGGICEVEAIDILVAYSVWLFQEQTHSSMKQSQIVADECNVCMINAKLFFLDAK